MTLSVKRLHLLILRSYIGPLILTFFIALFLLLMQFLWKYIDDLVGKGLAVHVIAELLLYTSASLIPLALPLAILLSSLMTFGNMGEHYELLALKSAGISLQRIMFPLIILTVVISISAFFFSNNVLPIANLKLRSLLYDVQRQQPELQIQQGIFYKGIEGYAIRIEKKDVKTNKLTNVQIYNYTERKGNTRVTVADSGYMRITSDEKYLVIQLFNGYNYYEMPEQRKPRRERTYPHRRDFFEEQKYLIELTGFGLNRTDEDLFRNSYQMMNLNMLEEACDSIYHVINKKSNDIYNRVKPKIGITEIKKPKIKPIRGKSHSFKAAKEATKTLVPDSINIDSIVIAQNKKEVDTLRNINPYKKIASISEYERGKVLFSAYSYVKSAHDYISITEPIFQGRLKILRKHEIEWHRKFTLSFACFIFFFIGAPLGAIIRKGGLGMPVIISIAFFILYYIVSMSGENFAKKDVLLPLQGMWLSSTILLPAGIFLTYKATTDSVVLNLDTYTNVFKRLFFFDKRTMSQAYHNALNTVLYPDYNLEDFKEQLTNFKKDLNDWINTLNLIIYKSDKGAKKDEGLLEYLDDFLREYHNLFKIVKLSPIRKNKPINMEVNNWPHMEFDEFSMIFTRRENKSIYKIINWPFTKAYDFICYKKRMFFLKKLLLLNEIIEKQEQLLTINHDKN